MSERAILLVEDNPDDEALTLRALVRNNIGNRVIVARDGVEAIDCLFGRGRWQQSGPASVQLVLLDLKLPRLDGLEVLRTIRQSPALRRTPVVILTSSNEECDLLKGYELGANSYVRKPVDFSEFNEAVKQLGLYWLLINEAPPTDRHG